MKDKLSHPCMFCTIAVMTYRQIGLGFTVCSVGHSTSIISCRSHIQSVCVLCSHCIVQHSPSSFSDSGIVSGPSDSCSRSSSGDTGEGELRTWSIQVRFCHSTSNTNVPCNQEGTQWHMVL